MSTLEDRLLGEKKEYYCSSSEDETEQPVLTQPGSSNDRNPNKWSGVSSNTGVKGVVEDFRRWRQLENEKHDQADREKLELAKKLSKFCSTTREDEQEKQRDENPDDEDDEFMKDYMRRRMEEMALAMRQKSENLNSAKVTLLQSADEFLVATDSWSNSQTVLVHIFEDDVSACESMNGCLECLAKDYRMIRFCKVKASALGTSAKFKKNALPTIQAYRKQQLIGNFIRLTDEFGEDFYADEVESYLKEYGVLPDLTCVAEVLKR